MNPRIVQSLRAFSERVDCNRVLGVVTDSHCRNNISIISISDLYALIIKGRLALKSRRAFYPIFDFYEDIVP